MRWFIAYLFLGAIVLNTMSRLVIYVDFLINQEFIAENLCENRDKPIMQCNGHCQLKEELEKDEERKEETVKHQVEIIPSIVEQVIFEFEVPSNVESIEKPIFYTLQIQPKDYNQSIFHPPTV